MTSGNAYPNLPDPDTSRERIELETRVLAAALRQSLERGDTEGSSQAHQQIFILLKASQEMGWEEPVSLPPDIFTEKARQMPDIDWGAPDESPIISSALPAEPKADEEILPASAEALPAIAETLPVNDESLEAVAEKTEIPVSVAVQPESEPESKHEPESESEAESESPQAEEQVQSDLRQTTPSFAVVPTFGPITVPSFAPSPINASKPEVNMVDYYLRMQVSQVADFGSIHKSFLRKVRPMLRRFAEENLTGQARKDALAELQSLWISHDILCDPVTRTDYDFRRLGLRGGAEEGETKTVSTRPQLRIGELLQCAGLLETTELEIAADMHKAMPELMFGAFLVKQSFIEEDDLNCVLLGQQLLKTGGITVAQFRDSMAERASSGTDLGDILVARQYLTPFQLQEAYRYQSEDTLPRIPAVTTTVSLQASEADVAESLKDDDENETDSSGVVTSEDLEPQGLISDSERLTQAPAEGEIIKLGTLSSAISSGLNSNLNAGNAVPSWKDQLDWSSPEEVSDSTGGALPSEAKIEDESIEPVRAPSGRHSLIDLMIDLKAPEPASTEQATDDPSSMGRILHGAEKVEDFAPPSLEHEAELSAVEEEFAALNAAADEALDLSDNLDTDVVEETIAPENTAPENTAVQSPSAAAAGSSTTEPSLAEAIAQQKESGSWQIVSVPASALASLLLDDEVEPEPPKSTKIGPDGKERPQLKTSFANDKPFTKSGKDKLPPGGERRKRRRSKS